MWPLSINIHLEFCSYGFYQIHWTSFSFQNDFKIQELPLARIKKIMKQDEEVKVSINFIEAN